MHHVCKPNLRFLGLLAIVFAAIIVPSAAAYPVLQDESNFVANTTKAPLVIPYLSHGVGVDASLYSGASNSGPDAFQRAVDRHAVLVNGLNATARSAAATRPDDRAGIHGIGTTSHTHSSARLAVTQHPTRIAGHTKATCADDDARPVGSDNQGVPVCFKA
jgi:hypothetical protein